MKAIILALCAIFAGTNAMVVITAGVDPPRLLGASHCTWGPSYWCQNLTIAAGCNATSHCVKKVWLHKTVEEDHDSVCEICKDMVKQARDQLKSNETQEDLKAVFEGSCKLMMIKPIVEECDTLVDQFIPELVETLASQMDPSVVCSVSGLCNSPRIDQLILEHEETLKKTVGKDVISLKDDELKPNECSKCFTIATRMEEKFKGTSRDQMLNEILGLCRNVGTQSDACANIVLQYFTTIYEHLKTNFNAKNICTLSGQCSGIFHKHEDSSNKGPDVEIRPLSSVGMVEVGDDLPCKLCEQLVGHLRDLLVANTTELEFQRVLEGFCKQTESFADQCKSIVDEYYPEMYEFLVHRLNGNAVCVMGGICPSPGTKESAGPIMPLLPMKTAEIGVRILNEKKKHKKYNLGENGAGIRKINKYSEAEKMQLPIERISNPLSLLSFPNMDAKGQELCAFCEYLLHEIQQVISDPKSEVEVKTVLGKICKKLPNSVEGTCDEFIDTYGNAIVAILAQEIDPSVVCPMMHVCPSEEMMTAFQSLDKEWMIQSEVEDKPSCPLCLFAVSQVYNVIKNNKTEENIVKELDKLCVELPKSLGGQCEDFVKAYSKELIEMLLSDLTPQEVCVYIKLCDETKEVAPSIFFPTDKNGEIMTNEIPDYQTAPIKPVQAIKDSVECVMCETVIKYIEDAMKDASTREEVKKIVHDVCNYFPKSRKEQCTSFVNTYADKIIEMFSQDVHPKLICMLIGTCPADNMQTIKNSVAECALCEAIISGIESVLTNPTVDKKIEKVVAGACNYVPANIHEKCVSMLEVYEQTIINLLKMNVSPQQMCNKMALCSIADFFAQSEALHMRR
ncbi:hypothetical protein PV328_008770 [Microctonus aethiopoides]|uniref:Prosaposin n=1 Tax=Microctonus aethiopoides TaxID=144406 RepID=A0AA39FJY9_9HYME|nr:hypothetical protein PV328_008770 [Microctonus aethiopoides]